MGITRILHYLLMSWIFNEIEINGVEIKRLVYQSILLSDGYDIASCYGYCDPSSSSANPQPTFNASDCLGSTINFGCPNSRYSIDIRKATLAKLRPDLDMCSHSRSVSCKENVLDKIKTICAGLYQCTINVMRDLIFMDCKNVKNPVLEIEYTCKIKPTLPSTSKRLITSASKESRPQTLESTFWLAIAYFTLNDTEKVRKSEIQMSLVLAVSLFIGTIVATCFCFAYCRQVKIRKQKIIQKALELEVRRQNNPLIEPPSCARNNHMNANHRQQAIELVTVKNGGIPEYKIVPQTELGDLDNVALMNYRHDYRISPSELPPSSLLKEYLKKENPTKASNENDEERSLSPSSLPPPPTDLLIDTSSSSSNELLPPPAGFKGDRSIPFLIVTNPSPPGSSSNSLETTSKEVPQDQCQIELEINDDDVEIIDNSNTIEENFTHYNGDDNSIGQPSDDYHSSPYMHRPILCHQKLNGNLSSTRNSFTTTSMTSNDDTSQDDSKNDFSRSRCKKHKEKCSGNLQKIKGLELLRKKGFNNQTLNRFYKKTKNRNTNGGLHQHKVVQSDNEASKRRIHKHKLKRSCSYYEQTGFTSAIPCISCGNPNETQYGPTFYTQLPREFNESQSSQTTNEDIKKLRFREESGYQTHDTGSDSLCSSPLSTDQEDSRMFMPAYVTPRYCSDICRNCEYSEESCRLDSSNNNTASDISRTSIDVPRKLESSHRKKFRGNILRAGLTDIDEKCCQRNTLTKSGLGGFETT